MIIGFGPSGLSTSISESEVNSPMAEEWLSDRTGKRALFEFLSIEAPLDVA